MNHRQIFLHFFPIFLFLSACSTYIKIPVVETMPPNYMKVMRGQRNIAVYHQSTFPPVGGGRYGNWSKTLTDSVENTLQEFKFYKLVDVKNREDRLKEVALSQTGITGDIKDLGRQLAIDGLLYLETPAPPVSQCDVRVSTHNKSICVSYNKEGKCLRYKQITETKYTGYRTTTVNIKGRLINVETGDSLTYAYNQPNVVSSHLGNPSCVSEQEGFSQAVRVAAFSIASNISPKMGALEVALYDDPVGVADENKDQVKALLKAGIKWADTEPPDYEEAYKNWKKALTISGDSSPSAYWNLAIYQWYKGDLMEAEQNFNESKSTGGPDWLNSKRMEIMARFKIEKERILMGEKK
ncbi:MAG: hypothetical protein H7A25_19440 [Leptospiraceae bacterium]|nr:hypothetical protein [Leptospiraceae bacterium]